MGYYDRCRLFGTGEREEGRKVWFILSVGPDWEVSSSSFFFLLTNIIFEQIFWADVELRMDEWGSVHKDFFNLIIIATASLNIITWSCK